MAVSRTQRWWRLAKQGARVMAALEHRRQTGTTSFSADDLRPQSAFRALAVLCLIRSPCAAHGPREKLPHRLTLHTHARRRSLGLRTLTRAWVNTKWATEAICQRQCQDGELPRSLQACHCEGELPGSFQACHCEEELPGSFRACH